MNSENRSEEATKSLLKKTGYPMAFSKQTFGAGFTNDGTFCHYKSITVFQQSNFSRQRYKDSHKGLFLVEADWNLRS